VLIPLRGRGGVAWLGAGLSTAIQVRRRQHELARDTTATLGLARRLLSLKLQQQRRPASPALPAPFDSLPSGTLDTALAQHRAALDQATDIQALMGQEGAAAAWYGWLAPPAAGTLAFQRTQPAARPRPGECPAVAGLHLIDGGNAERGAGRRAGPGTRFSARRGTRSGIASAGFDGTIAAGGRCAVLRLLDHSLQPHHFTSRPSRVAGWIRTGAACFITPGRKPVASGPCRLAPASGSSAALPMTAEVETAADQSLRTQCRRLVHWLRLWLQPGEEGLETDELSEDDDG